MSSRIRRLALGLGVLLAAAPAAAQTPKTFPPPTRTAWRPLGCRTPDPIDARFASRAAWRSLHSDEVNSDEVSIAYPPVTAWAEIHGITALAVAGLLMETAAGHADDVLEAVQDAAERGLLSVPPLNTVK